jgi:hypothetical protein
VTAEPDSPESTPASTGQPEGLDSRPSAPASTDGGPNPAAGPASPQERVAAIANERPEAAVGAAFAGGLLLALILKRLAR